MSKGIGRAQGLVLRALASLVAQDGQSHFYVWAIHDRCFELSPGLQDTQAAVAARIADLERQSAAGDRDAARLLMLRRLLTRRPGARQRRKAPPVVDGKINLSRALASLSRRGLVDHHARRGGGSAGITEQGRAVVRQLLSDKCRIKLAQK